MQIARQIKKLKANSSEFKILKFAKQNKQNYTKLIKKPNKSLIFHNFLNPLTTTAESYSDLPEIFTTDSLNFLQNKMLLHEFFSSRGY